MALSGAPMDGVFDGLDEEFNTEYDENIIVPEDDDMEEKNLPVVAKSKAVQVSDDVVIVGTEYVSDEIKSLIDSSKSVLGRLDSTIKIGGAPRLFEVYSQLTNSITAQIKEFRHMHEAVAKIKLEEKKKNINKIETGDNITFTSEQVLDLIIKEKNRSEIETIDADFVVDDTEILDKHDDEDDDNVCVV